MGRPRDKLITSKMAGKLLGFTPDYIRRLCLDGKIKGEKIGNNWLIKTSAIKDIKRQRTIKNKEETNGDS